MLSCSFKEVPNGSCLNSKVNNWETEIAGVSYVKFEHMKGTVNILADCISRLKPIVLYDPLTPDEHVQEFGHAVIELLPPILVNHVWQTKDTIVSIQLDENEVKKLQAACPQPRSIFDHIHDRKFNLILVSLLDSQVIIF